MMRAAIAERAGAPQVLQVCEVPRPAARPGWALIEVKAAGLNRSELMTRQGHSPNVRFPRVLGIECVGVVAEPSDSGLAAGTTVAAVMGEMGREFDAVGAIRPGGVEYVLDLIGAPTVVESLRLAAPGGTVCVTGMLSGVWVLPDFEPVAMIPSGTKLTAFHSDDLAGAAGAAALQHVVDGVAAGAYHANLDRVFDLDDVVLAHQYMEANQATGKVVLRTRRGS
jgi:NADPH:quinone reductase-like Zn-dependent oxidoreductase